MLDSNLLRNKLELISKKLARRGFSLNIEEFSFMEKKRKKLQIKTEKLQSSRNKLSKLIGQKKNTNTDIKLLIKRVSKINQDLSIIQLEFNELKEKIHNFLINLPNIPDSNIPNGTESINNKEIMRWGKIKQYNFLVQDHVFLGENIQGFDWNTAAKMSGSRFVIMKGKIALLHRALGQFMLDIHTKENGYLETNVPYLVNQKSLYGTGQLPKFSDDLFHINTFYKEKKTNNYILIPTAEVPLTNIIQNKILKENELPIKLTALTPCFRSESSSYGKDTRGLIRTHQFDKVELVQIVHPDKSMEALEKLTNHAEKILQLLKLPYRKVLLCSGEIGFSATKTYDLEVWFPSQKIYREISSCSNMSDFQARRIQARFFNESDKKKYFVHTINGSGLAIGRTLAAILENYQCKNGSIKVPEVLRKPYMNNLKFIS
ncbi:serine--tRNA ligase [Buchnera aphidicola (Pemphigus obesinymphae)]|uniref:serine--tRNA ligase n=1 Tax=Buchnera aphidicola TaxID=9 RepID=UPI0022381FE6|nr:serine--tRNA ligase [Buchnera aphidicola]MCW5196780.1 serine--tRNA ligase [Buchnera aphidicola (Pemphigus obesinymphae)]